LSLYITNYDFLIVSLLTFLILAQVDMLVHARENLEDGDAKNVIDKLLKTVNLKQLETSEAAYEEAVVAPKRVILDDEFWGMIAYAGVKTGKFPPSLLLYSKIRDASFAIGSVSFI